MTLWYSSGKKSGYQAFSYIPDKSEASPYQYLIIFSQLYKMIQIRNIVLYIQIFFGKGI